MESLRLREATDAEASVILALLREANAPYRHRPGGPSGAFEDTVECTRAMMATVPVLLAMMDEQIVGCVFYAREAGHVDLFRLAVLPAYQRRGIGRALVKEVEARARAMRLLCTRLGVRRAMPENRAWYERLGYRVIGETETGWGMEKRLAMPESNITIREATDTDVPEIVTVLRTAFAEQATLAPPSGALSESEESVRGLMRTARVALAMMDDAIAGCQFFEPKGDHLYLFRLAVLPAFRAHGVGRALIAYAEEQARTMGMPRTHQRPPRVAPAARLVRADGLHLRRIRHPHGLCRTDLRHPRQRPHDVDTPPSPVGREAGGGGLPINRRTSARSSAPTVPRARSAPA